MRKGQQPRNRVEYVKRFFRFIVYHEKASSKERRDNQKVIKSSRPTRKAETFFVLVPAAFFS